MMTRFMLLLLSIHTLNALLMLKDEAQTDDGNKSLLPPLAVAGVNVEHKESRFLNTEFFMDTVESRYFVDKSNLIRTFFDFRGNEHVVLHGPKRFGKTVNMNMIQEFVEIETDENGHTADRSNLTKWNVFKKLAIGQDKEVFREYFAAFPVLHLVFDMTFTSYDDFLDKFAIVIKKEFKRQGSRHFFNGGNYVSLKPAFANDPELVRIYTKYTIHPENLSKVELFVAGYELATLLYRRFRRRVIVLIDEYDAPITQATLNPDISNDDAEKIIDFLTTFLKSLVKPSKAGVIKRSLLTGITRVGSTSSIGINNLMSYRIFDHPKIAPYYGFTREEVIHLTKKFSVEDKIDAITDYYDGFKTEKGSSMFCMESVISFLDSGKIIPYWDPFGRYFDSLFEYEHLGGYLDANMDKVITINIEDLIEKEDFLLLKKYIKRKNFTEDRYPTFNLILQMLVEEGAFTIVRRFGWKNAHIKIPNLEVKEQLFDKMYTTEFLLKKFMISKDILEKYARSAIIIENDNSRFIGFKNAISVLLNQTKPLNKADMQGALCGVLQGHASIVSKSGILYVSKGGRVKNVPKKQSKSENHDMSELTTSKYDCLYVFRNLRSGDVGILLELKYKKESSMLALTQILDRQYYKTFDQDLKKRNIFNITTEVLIGIHYDPTANKTSLSYLWNDRDLEKAQHV
nr:PREDICTED: uncharacterized protein LOC109040463 [Bemisia tabaci]